MCLKFLTISGEYHQLGYILSCQHWRSCQLTKKHLHFSWQKIYAFSSVIILCGSRDFTLMLRILFKVLSAKLRTVLFNWIVLPVTASEKWMRTTLDSSTELNRLICFAGLIWADQQRWVAKTCRSISVKPNNAALFLCIYINISICDMLTEMGKICSLGLPEADRALSGDLNVMMSSVCQPRMA